MTRAVTLALLITVLAVGSVVLASMLPDMPSLIPVDGYDGPTDQPVDAATCEVIGCSPADLTGTDSQPGAIP